MLTNRARASRVTDVSEGETYKEKGVPGSRPLTASALGTLSLFDVSSSGHPSLMMPLLLIRCALDISES